MDPVIVHCAMLALGFLVIAEQVGLLCLLLELLIPAACQTSERSALLWRKAQSWPLWIERVHAFPQLVDTPYDTTSILDDLSISCVFGFQSVVFAMFRSFRFGVM